MSLKKPPSSGVAWGVACGLIAAVGYTAANICLRAAADVDPIWVSAIKTIPVLAASGLLLLRNFAVGRLNPLPRWMLVELAVAGLVGHLLGNVAFQWALGVIGVALDVPITMGTIIASGAVLGWLLLGERVTTRGAVSLVLLATAIALLSLGGDAAAPDAPWRRVAAGVAAACLAGSAYSYLGIAIRRSRVNGAPLGVPLFLVSGMGAMALFPFAAIRLGYSGMAATTAAEWRYMIGAGVFNALAFFALTHSFKVLNVVAVNALNSAQIAMCALAGVWLFGEPATPWLTLGCGLTLAGLFLMERQSGPPPSNEAPRETGDDSENAYAASSQPIVDKT